MKKYLSDKPFGVLIVVGILLSWFIAEMGNAVISINEPADPIFGENVYKRLGVVGWTLWVVGNALLLIAATNLFRLRKIAVLYIAINLLWVSTVTFWGLYKLRDAIFGVGIDKSIWLFLNDTGFLYSTIPLCLMLAYSVLLNRRGILI